MTRSEPNPPHDEPVLPGEHPPYKPADDHEEIYFDGSPHLRGSVSSLLVHGIIALVLIALPVLDIAYGWTWWPWWLSVISVLVAIIVALLPWLINRTIRFRVSNYRIDYERGLLSRSIDTLELWHVDDIKFHQSLLDRILKVGSIIIISNDDTTPVLEMHGIPDPRPIFESLKQRVIQVKRQRGVIKMDI